MLLANKTVTTVTVTGMENRVEVGMLKDGNPTGPRDGPWTNGWSALGPGFSQWFLGPSNGNCAPWVSVRPFVGKPSLLPNLSAVAATYCRCPSFS